MANIDLALNVSDGIALEDSTTGLVSDTILLTQGSIDPTLGLGFDAPIGSLFLRRDGAIYSKTTAPDTGWVLNTATGSTQNLFETFNGDAGTISAISPTDSLTIAGGSGITTSLVGSTLTINSLVSSDELVKVTSDDTTADYLFNKLLAGTLISISETNPGGNERVTISTTAEINTVSNLGAGTAIFSSKLGSVLQFKTLIGGTGISLSSNVNEVTITNTDPHVAQNLWETIVSDSGNTVANTNTDTLNILGGSGITTSIVGDTLTIDRGVINTFNSISIPSQSDIIADSETDTLNIVAGVGISLTTDAGTDTLTITNTLSGSSGEANTASNVGTGVGVFKQKNLVDLEFKSIIGGTGIDAVSNVDDVTLNLNAGIADLNDVTVTGVADANLLAYDNGTSQWVNVPAPPSPPPGGSGSIQIVFGSISGITGTTSIVVDNALPLVTEGTELWTANITTQTTTSTIRIVSNVTTASSNSSMEIVMVVYRDGVAIGSVVNTTANKDSGHIIAFEIYDTPAVIATLTYSVRIGKNGGPGTWYANSLPGLTTPLGDTLQQNSFTVEEIGLVS